jgi:hypothetical protein
MIEKPWYRHFWLWFMLTPVIGSVIAGFVTLYLAGAPPSLVVDDFNRIALAIELDQQRDQRATELDVTARLQLKPELASSGQVVAVSLTGTAPDGLTLELVHPTLEHMDQRVTLKRDADGYAGSVVRADTRLYVLLSDDTGKWRLTGVLEPGQNVLDLKAKH